MTEKKECLMPKEGGPCRCCDGKYRQVKRPSGSVTPFVFRFGVDNVATKFRVRVFICDPRGHIEFFNVKEEVEDPNA